MRFCLCCHTCQYYTDSGTSSSSQFFFFTVLPVETSVVEEYSDGVRIRGPNKNKNKEGKCRACRLNYYNLTKRTSDG